MAIDIEVEAPIAIITVDGLWTMQIGNAARAKSLKIIQEQDLSGVLLDLRKADWIGSISTADLYEVANKYLRTFPKGTKYAFVYSPTSDQVVSDLSFLETVSVNRGIRVKVFRVYETAKQWLLS